MLDQLARYFGLTVFVLLMIAFSGALFSQEAVVRHFSEEEGLPGNDVYDILSATSGYMWFATDNGVSRYDGHTFKNYNVSDGLPTNSVLKLYEDLLGRIWFLAYNGMLSCYDKDEIFAYQYNDSIIKYFTDNYLSKICVDSSGGILLSPRQGGRAYITAEGSIHTRMNLIPRWGDSIYLTFEDYGNDHFMSILNEKPDAYEQNGSLFHMDNKYYLKIDCTAIKFQRNYLKTANGEYVVSYRNSVYVIKDYMLIAKKDFEEEVLSLYNDKQGHLWVSIKFNHGIYMFDNALLNGQASHFFDDYTVTSVRQDREGDYWFSTEGHGVFFIPTFDFNLYTLPGENRNLNVMALEISGDRLWFSTREKELYSGRISKGRISDIRRTDIGNPKNWIHNIIVDRDGYLWLSSTRYLRYDPAGFPRPLDTVIFATCLGKARGDTIYASFKRLGIYVGNELLLLGEPGVGKRIYSIFPEDPAKVWLGTLYGLYLFNGQNYFFKGDLAPVLNERINCINKIGDMLVVGTAAHGLVLLKGDSTAHLISTQNDLSGDAVKSVFIQNDSILWVCTKSGLNKILFSKSGSEYYIESYAECDGLPSDEINRISMHDGYIWLATGSGLVSFLPDDVDPHEIPPIIKISNIQINDRDTAVMDKYVLDHDQNNIRISMTGISFREGGSLKYRYMLSNYNDEIVETKNQWAYFSNLSPGDYTFFVNVGNAHGVWNEAPESIRFHIKKHYTQTIWFLILLILVSSLLLAGILIFLHRQQKIKGKARMDLTLMEQKMFRSQMNPHFVFNALLAIQGFMYQNNPRDAGRYLTSFAKLIRHTLYGSSEEYISLDQEIEAMEYYMDLQRLRFNEKFEYHVKTEGDLMPESIKIPPMLIQPFIENAIEHGLQHMNGKGKLLLSFEMPDVYLKIIIEDNGIGREEAMKLQQKRSRLHKSLGMEIMRKRIASLNLIMDKKISLTILDLKDAAGNGIGTRVTIYIPHRSV